MLSGGSAKPCLPAGREESPEQAKGELVKQNASAPTANKPLHVHRQMVHGGWCAHV